MGILVYGVLALRNFDRKASCGVICFVFGTITMVVLVKVSL